MHSEDRAKTARMANLREDLDQLDLWLRRAVHAKCEDDLFQEVIKDAKG